MTIASHKRFFELRLREVSAALGDSPRLLLVDFVKADTGILPCIVVAFPDVQSEAGGPFILGIRGKQAIPTFAVNDPALLTRLSVNCKSWPPGLSLQFFLRL